MNDKVRFAADLFQGTAEYYDRYRLPYSDSMLTDLVSRAQVSGSGRLLDLACGTGQLAFPLRRRFAEVWAVDQEPDMVAVVRAKADAAGAQDVRPVVSSAEILDVQSEYFEMAVVGNAFHRLDRDVVARRVHEWLRPGGHMALCWLSGPWEGEADWQRTYADVLSKWQVTLGVEDRVPVGWDEDRQDRPDVSVLSDAGFEVVGRHEFAGEYRWSLPELAGYVRSTSLLPVSVLGDQAAAFDADLAETLRPHADDGSDTFTAAMSFAYELVRKPASDH